MPDRESVIATLQHCASAGPCTERKYKLCPYGQYGNCAKKMAQDVLELLEEQEPVQFKVTRQAKNYPFWDSVVCTGCGYETCTVKDYWKYCPVCGRKVKWDAAD